jgi:hypothetical protein
MKKFKNKLIGCAVILLSVLSITTFFSMSQTSAAANTVTPETKQCKEFSKSFLTFPAWNRGLKCEKKTITNDQGKVVSTVVSTKVPYEENGIPTFVWTVVLNCLDILLRVAGILAVVFLMYNGFQYLTSSGSADKISKAKTGMWQSIVGLLIAASASTIIYFIVEWIAK